MMRQFDASLKFFFLSEGLYQIARTLPHAVLTVILISKGMNLSEIALIQSAFMVAVLLFEVPSGILSDLFSEKLLYLSGLTLMTLSNVIIYLSDRFILLVVAWFIYGCATAAKSGSLDAYFIKQAADEQVIKRLSVYYNDLSLMSILLGGGIGGLLYTLIGEKLYIVSIVLLVLSSVLTTRHIHIKPKHVHQVSPWYHFVDNLHAIIAVKELRFLVSLMMVYQIVVQLFFQYWQYILLEKGFDSGYFGYVYVVFQLIGLVANRGFRKLSLKDERAMAMLPLFLGMSLACFIIKTPLVWAIVSLVVFLASFNLYGFLVNYRVQLIADKIALSTTVSILGVLSSLSGLLVMWLSSGLFYFMTIEHGLLLLVASFTLLTSYLVINYHHH